MTYYVLLQRVVNKLGSQDIASRVSIRVIIST